VGALLSAQGHEVFTPTLTGLGERKHFLTDSIGLNTHIEDISNVLFYEDLEQVILVGHSYAGMVITGVANQAPGQIRHLVYLDADTPVDGQSLSDLHPESVKRIADLAAEQGDHVFMPPSGECGS
jgi:pimeloyl-ACP methyl ester carboxylesterase